MKAIVIGRTQISLLFLNRIFELSHKKRKSS